VHQLADHLFRHESGKMVAILTGIYGSHHLQMAEDVVQEALVRALKTWPYSGTPENPTAWLLRTAKNLALDQLRREKNFREKQEKILAGMDEGEAGEDDESGILDDQLRLMFVCCHPALPQESQTALALKTLCGLSPAEIARAFLISEAAVFKRLTRARLRIRELALPFAVPDQGELPARLDGVLATLYLLFNEGYKASSGERLVREDLCHEAIRLLLLLTGHPATQGPRAFALLALMLLNAARLTARTDDAGNLLRLHEQDRALWDQGMIGRGIHCLALSAQGETLSEYHLEAAIAACHSTAAEDAATDWARILMLYDQLVLLSNSPVVALNRAVAVARVHGPQAGLEAIDGIATSATLETYHLVHAIRGTFAGELGHRSDALGHFRRAEKLAILPAERDFIARRIGELESGGMA
jgi:RNA polymerase sigma factor (sigma-70 family)